MVRAFSPGDDIVREARAVLWDTRDGSAYKALLSLTDDAVLSWEPQPGKQPNATVDEFHDCDEALRKNPDVVAALARRGVTDMSLVLIDVWTYGGHLDPGAVPRAAGSAGATSGCGRTDVQPVRPPGQRAEVHRGHEHHGAAGDRGPLRAPGSRRCRASTCPSTCPGYRERTGRKPLEITQPEGPSFTVDGNLIRWQNWELRAGFNYREGLVLHQVGWRDGDRLRPIAHRISFAEMVVPYRDPTPDHVRRTAYDIGEWGLG